MNSKIKKSYKQSSRRVRPLTLADVDIAIESQDGETIALYLRRNQLPERSVLLRLAALFDPSPTFGEDWKLEFTRRKAGNSRSSFSAIIEKSWLGIQALELRVQKIAAGAQPLEKQIVSEIAERNHVSPRKVREAIKLASSTREFRLRQARTRVVRQVKRRSLASE